MTLTVSRVVAVAALAAFMIRPRDPRATAVLAAGAAVELALGVSPVGALSVVLPVVVFLGAALTLASLVARSGLADRAAIMLARLGRGSTAALYALTCAACGALTCVVSLDGAVVLMVPVLSALKRRCSVPFAPLFVGVVVVANVASLALPQGNPTNLVLMQRLGLSALDFTRHMFLPGSAAAVLAAAVVAVHERRALGKRYAPAEPERGPLSGAERRAAALLAAAAIAAWTAPLLGVAPWWPFAGAVVVGALAARQRPQLRLAGRVGLEVGALVVVVSGLAIGAVVPAHPGLAALVAVAAAVGAAAAVANNLPVSVSGASLLAGHSGYAAAIGLAAGSLALPRGSVATIVALDAAAGEAPTLTALVLAPIAIAAVLVATIVLWISA